MAFLSKAEVEQALPDQLRSLSYGIEGEEGIGPDGRRPERECCDGVIFSWHLEVIAALAQFRGTLPPRLVSGELRVQGAEAFLKKQSL